MTEDIDFLNQVDQGYIGLTKPKVMIVREDKDKFLYMRLKTARALGMHPDELEDEPDEMSDHSDDQGWE